MTETQIAALIATFLGPARLASSDVMRLALRIQQTAPKDASPQQKKRLRDLVSKAREVDEVHKARARFSPTRLAEPRNEVVNAWVAIDEALAAGSRLPDEAGSRGARYRQMKRTLFPTGTAFVKLDGGAVWSEGHRLLERIEEDDLEGEIDALIGKEFLAHVRHTMDILADVLGLNGSTPAPSSSSLTEAMASFQVTLTSYTRSLAADVDERDPESVARFFAAVAPIDQFRSTRAVEEVTEEQEPVTPSEPSDPTPTS